MTGAALEAAMRDVSAPRLRRHLEWFAGVRRDTGGPGEDRAVAYIVEQLAATGVGVDVHEFDAFLSYPGRASLEIAGSSPVRFDALTHSFAASTPAGGLDVDLVRCQPGELGSARGLAVVVEGLATPVTILQASRAGCAAVVFVNEDRAIHNMIGTTIRGTPSLNQLDRLPTLPAVSISSDAGVTLKQHLENGRRLPARLHSEVTTGRYRSKLPEVRIAGTRDPDLFCLVGGHYCAWDVGVTDNATGDACMLEMARLLWDRRSDLERGVRICWWPGHSHGRYSGSHVVRGYVLHRPRRALSRLLQHRFARCPRRDRLRRASHVRRARGLLQARHPQRNGAAGRRGSSTVASGRPVVSRQRHPVVLGLPVPAGRASRQAAVDRWVGERVVVAHRRRYAGQGRRGSSCPGRSRRPGGGRRAHERRPASVPITPASHARSKASHATSRRAATATSI